LSSRTHFFYSKLCRAPQESSSFDRCVTGAVRRGIPVDLRQWSHFEHESVGAPSGDLLALLHARRKSDQSTKTQVVPETSAHETHELQVHTGEIGNLIDDFDLFAPRVACSSIRPFPWSLRCARRRVSPSTCWSIASTLHAFSILLAPHPSDEHRGVPRGRDESLRPVGSPRVGRPMYDRVKEVDGLPRPWPTRTRSHVARFLAGTVLKSR